MRALPLVPSYASALWSFIGLTTGFPIGVATYRIVSTLPSHLSRWLRLDLPHRVERATGLPVTHVVASEERAGATR